MSFDKNSLPRVIDTAAGNALMGLREENPNIVDQACTVIERSALKGQLQYLDSAETLPRDVPSAMPGENLKFKDAALSTTNYDMEVYRRGYRFTDEEYEDYSQYIDVLGQHFPLLFAEVETGLSLDLLTLLQAETNNQAAVNGAWDVETSTPVEDMMLGIRTYVPGADLVIVGANTADDLKVHVDTKEAVSNYAGRGSLGGDEALAAVLRNVLGVKEVKICRQIYNSANEGQTASASYVFGDWFWAGFKSNLIYAKQKNTDGTTRSWIDEDTDSTLLSYKRVGDLIRPSTDGGVEFTGVGT
jgi:hypothetical protein